MLEIEERVESAVLVASADRSLAGGVDLGPVAAGGVGDTISNLSSEAGNVPFICWIDFVMVVRVGFGFDFALGGMGQGRSEKVGWFCSIKR